tara:strand:+ start:739 stop:1872 length:1134 start_codon:yes stop_codon:yes gene_type:complete
MATQQPGVPRFMVDEHSFLRHNGVDLGNWIGTSSTQWEVSSGHPFDLLDLDPSTEVEFTLGVDGVDGNDTNTFILNNDFPFTAGLNYFVAILNHNFQSKKAWFRLDAYGANNVDSEYHSGQYWPPTSIINAHNNDYGVQPEYDGFTIAEYTSRYTDRWRIQINPHGATAYNNPTGESYTPDLPLKLGAIMIGQIYDLVSPSLNISMSRTMDGVNRVRTKGGVDLVNTRNTKNNWGSLGPWELRYPDPKPILTRELGRVGKRSWDLNFTMQGKDLFPPTENLSPEILDTTGYTEGTDYNEVEDDQASRLEWNSDKQFLRNDDFYTQVIHKAQNRPFIFMPDKDNKNPDQFALAIISDFTFNQISKGVYSVNLKIDEVS